VNKLNIYKCIKIILDMIHKPELSEKIRQKFGDGAKSFSKNDEYNTQGEWELKGLTKFKIKVLGMWGRETVKTLDELAEILVELRIIDSQDNAKQLIQEFYEREVCYRGGRLIFTKVYNKKEQEACRINREDPIPAY
jgi:hypothetical protein